MSIKSFYNLFASLIVTLVFSFSLQAQASSLSKLFQLLHSPTVRYALTKTPEGVALRTRILTGAAATDDMQLLVRESAYDANELLQRLASPLLKPHANEIAMRLSGLSDDLSRALIAVPNLNARTALHKIASNSLAIKLTRSDSIVFVKTEGSPLMALEEDFLRAVNELSLDPNLTRLALGGEGASKMSPEAAAKFKEQLLEAQKLEAGITGEQFPTMSQVGLNPGPKQLVQMDGFDVRFSNFRQSELTYAQFEGALLDGSILSESALRASNFNRAQMPEAVLIGSDLRDATFLQADLRGVNFSRTKIAGANFAGADLRGANMSNAHARGIGFDQLAVNTNFRGAIFNAETKLPFSRRKAEELGMIFVEAPTF